MAKPLLVRSPAQWDAFRDGVYKKSISDSSDFVFCKDFSGDPRIAQVGPPDDRRIGFTISTGAVDRDGDTIDPGGWIFDDYLNNPVVLWNHQIGDPPIARTELLNNSGGVVRAEAIFPTKSMHPFAGMIYDLLVNKFIRGASVGYKSFKYEPSPRGKGISFKVQSMHEWSVVPIPCNPNGLADAKSFGIDIGPLKEWLDEQIEVVAGEPAFVIGESKVGDFLREAYVKAYGSKAIIVPEMPEMDVDLAHDLDGDGVVVVKAGRVVSAANESKIREAMSALGDILSRLKPSDAGMDASGEISDAQPDVPGGDVVRTNSEPDKVGLGGEDQEDVFGTIELTDEEDAALANSRGDRNGPQPAQSKPGISQNVGKSCKKDEMMMKESGKEDDKEEEEVSDDEELDEEEMMMSIRKPPMPEKDGVKAMSECAKCGCPLGGHEKFCPECGFGVPSRGPGSQSNPGKSPGVGKGASNNDNDSVILVFDDNDASFGLEVSETRLKAMIANSLEDGLIGLTGKLPR